MRRSFAIPQDILKKYEEYNRISSAHPVKKRGCP